MSQPHTLASRHHPRPASPVEVMGPPAAQSLHQCWWRRLPADERSHTKACVEADDVDGWMLDILGRNGPVGPYGVRWAGDSAGFLPGSFVDFILAAPGDPRGDGS